MISNGYDTQEVMGALFGRLKWRSLNPGGTYPLNLSVGSTRADFYIKAGTSAGLTVGGTTYADSSLIGWTYRVLLRAIGPLKPQDPASPQPDDDITIDTVNGGFAMINPSLGTWANGQIITLEFQPQQAVAPNQVSGRYYEQFHPMCNLPALQATLAPQLSPTDFTTFLTDLEQGMIMTMLNGVFNMPQLIESTMIFDRQLRNDIAYTNYQKFVGYRIFVAPGEFAAKIARATFIFNGVATFNLYVYQDMQNAPIYTQQITTVAGQEVLVNLQDWVLHYSQKNYSQGGVFYIGYYQNDLGSVQALDQFVSRWNQSLAFGYTAMEAVQQDPAVYNFVRIQVPYTFKTYGMNLQIETYRDYTIQVVRNASLFDEVLGLSMACIVLGYQAYSIRSNVTERLSQDIAKLLYSEINNSGEASDINPYVAGLKMQIRRELTRLRRTFFPDAVVETTRPPMWGTQGLQGVFP